MTENVFSPNYGTPDGEKSMPPIGTPKSEIQTNGLPPIVELKDICQSYDNGELVFDKLNLSIPDIPDVGQFITIMGPSGCGKSTILRYIANLQQPTSGTILFRGHQRQEKQSVPMVFQQYTNLEWKTVLKNVMLPLELQNIPKAEAQEKAIEILKVVGLQDHAKKWAKYPILSGGQLQRVAIARGLVMNPDIILMDEPFGALDIKIRQEMQIFLRQIFEAQKDMTIILVTHSVSEAVFLSDQIIVLGGKPAGISEIIDVNLGSVREESIIGTSLFREYEVKVRNALGL